jgi:PBP1b-binding outer membrane lipoprotein LpoB
MRILYFLLGILVLFSSCVSTKKYTKYVHDQLKPDQFDTIARINFSYKGPTSVDSIKVTKLKSYFVPAIFYWGVRNKMLCESRTLCQVF